MEASTPPPLENDRVLSLQVLALAAERIAGPSPAKKQSPLHIEH